MTTEYDKDEPQECPYCAGTGEGQYDGTSCQSCKGSGIVKHKPDTDDYDGPEPDDFEPWDGDL